MGWAAQFGHIPCPNEQRPLNVTLDDQVARFPPTEIIPEALGPLASRYQFGERTFVELVRAKPRARCQQRVGNPRSGVTCTCEAESEPLSYCTKATCGYHGWSGQGVFYRPELPQSLGSSESEYQLDERTFIELVRWVDYWFGFLGKEECWTPLSTHLLTCSIAPLPGGLR